jgi:hypothetical protein
MISTARIQELFVLNVFLQLFDGIATYYGVAHWGEGNPIVATLIAYLGVGMALFLVKLKACGFLWVLRRLQGRPLVVESLAGLATAYACFSFIPWMSRFLSLIGA